MNLALLTAISASSTLVLVSGATLSLSLATPFIALALGLFAASLVVLAGLMMIVCRNKMYPHLYSDQHTIFHRPLSSTEMVEPDVRDPSLHPKSPMHDEEGMPLKGAY